MTPDQIKELAKQAGCVRQHLLDEADTLICSYLFTPNELAEFVRLIRADDEVREPVVNNKFTRAWVRLSELPGTMMQGPQGLFGPVPASTSTWITTSERERDHQIGNGHPMLELFTTPVFADDEKLMRQALDALNRTPNGDFHADSNAGRELLTALRARREGGV